MFSHIMIGSNDLDRAKRFYDALFAAVDRKAGFNDAKGRVIYANRGGVLMITKPIDGNDATFANGGTIGFTMDNAAEVDAWHTAGVAAGGKTAEDPPGVRDGGFGKLYLAYLRDPDGHKLCAMHRLPA